MPRPLFVYGTLRDPDVLELVLGRVLAGAAATAPGYRAVGMPGRSYPGLRRQPGATAEGLLLSGLSGTDLALLDLFEGEEYSRGDIEIIVTGRVVVTDVYWPVPPMPADAGEWRLAEWRARHKNAFLAAERESIAELRRRLSGANSAPQEET